MISRWITLVIFTVIICEVSCFRDNDNFTGLEDFGKVMNSSLVLLLQENPQFLEKVISNLIADLKAFFVSNFGYNRLILSNLVDKTLNDMQLIIPADKMSKWDYSCIARNKFILFFLVREATLDATCLENQVRIASKSVANIYEKIVELKGLHGVNCTMGVFCRATKGFSWASIGAALSTNFLDLGITAFDFFSAVRRCQKNVGSLSEVFDLTIENIKLCLSLNV